MLHMAGIPLSESQYMNALLLMMQVLCTDLASCLLPFHCKSTIMTESRERNLPAKKARVLACALSVMPTCT